MIYLAICFLQLVCSKHFLIQTEDTNEDSRETNDLGLNYDRGGSNDQWRWRDRDIEHGWDYNEEVNEQQKSTEKIQNEIHKNEKKKLKKMLGKAANQAGMPKKEDSGADNHPRNGQDYRYVPPYYPDTYDDSNYDDGSKGLSAYYRALLQRNG